MLCKLSLRSNRYSRHCSSRRIRKTVLYVAPAVSPSSLTNICGVVLTIPSLIRVIRHNVRHIRAAGTCGGSNHTVNGVKTSQITDHLYFSYAVGAL
jgi:hypothetical protein